jgi:CheY-like chemotaxis protein
VITIVDTGEGMTEAEQRQVFEPFFTTKDVGVGTGLGLTTAYGIVQQNGGDIVVQSRVGRGTIFRVYLPHATEAPESASSTDVEASGAGHSETILFVEDDEALRKLGASVLSRNGHSVLTAKNGEEALRIAKSEYCSFDLLVTDVVMPKMGGPRLVELLRQDHPELRVLYMSGYAESALVQDGSLEKGSELLTKPFTRAELLQSVSRQLAAR